METHPQLVQWWRFSEGISSSHWIVWGFLQFSAKTNPLIKQSQVKMDMAWRHVFMLIQTYIINKKKTSGMNHLDMKASLRRHCKNNILCGVHTPRMKQMLVTLLVGGLEHEFYFFHNMGLSENAVYPQL